MRLPSFLECTPGTQIHLQVSDWLSRKKSDGIQPEYVEFVNNVYAAQQGTRDAVVALLRDAAEPMRGIARSNIRVVQVFNGWHVSDSDANEHLTVYFPVNGETCHVYRNGTYVCFPVN